MGVVLLTASGALFLIQAAQSAGTSSAQALFETNCAACHGTKGDGDTMIGKQLQARDLRSPEVQKKTDTELSASIVNGKNNKMPPFKGKLKAEEVTALLKYIRETLRTKK
jgi:mono/diheme cytochrome c family protein